jgi:molybdopterin-binding protein
MNRFHGKITAITSSGNISLVDAEVAGKPMSAIVIGTPENTAYLRAERDIILLFKESEVSIGKNLQGQISLRNQLDGVITEIISGQIFSKITLDIGNGPLVALITTRAAQRLQLQVGDQVTAFIKANEVILMDPENG